MNKYVAFYAANGETETFKTFEEAEKWLKDFYAEDADEGFAEETCAGDDFIAEITHKSAFVETENKKNYKWDEKASAYINDEGEEWLSEFDAIGEIKLIPVALPVKEKEGI